MFGNARVIKCINKAITLPSDSLYSTNNVMCTIWTWHIGLCVGKCI